MVTRMKTVGKISRNRMAMYRPRLPPGKVKLLRGAGGGPDLECAVWMVELIENLTWQYRWESKRGDPQSSGSPLIALERL